MKPKIFDTKMCEYGIFVAKMGKFALIDSFQGYPAVANTSPSCAALHLPNIYKIYILQKNWSKSANPFLGSGPNILLPLIWGSHHQLDDQYKEPMVNTKII